MMVIIPVMVMPAIIFIFQTNVVAYYDVIANVLRKRIFFLRL